MKSSFINFLRTFLKIILVRPLIYILFSVRENKKLRDNTIHSILWDRAINESADYASSYLSEVMVFNKASEIWDYSIDHIADSMPNVILEFGCYSGTSINYFAKRLPNCKLVGFDSFEGLPEDWHGHHAVKGSFGRKGVMPNVLKNVELIPGWFDDSVPQFLENTPSLQVPFIHIDSDTYKSATTVLSSMRHYMHSGMLILFDEYFGYPNWRNGEFLAWKEFTTLHSIKYKYKAFGPEQALIEIISINASDHK